MKAILMISAILLVSTLSAAEVPTPEVQIAAAVLAAPTDLREGAAVLGYNVQGQLVKLREGKNELICLANDAGNTSLSVSCYHRDLEPYMARGRELLGQKITGQKRNEIRWKEIAEGKLLMPREPRTLYILTGSRFDAGSGKVIDPYLRWGVAFWPNFKTPLTGGPNTHTAIGGFQAKDVAVYNNIVIGPVQNAIHWSSTSSGGLFYGNTIHNVRVAFAVFSRSSATIRNNIISKAEVASSVSGASVTEHYNIFYASDGPGVARGAHSTTADPKFVNPTPAGPLDVKLQSGSPAIHSGSTLTSTYKDALSPSSAVLAVLNA